MSRPVVVVKGITWTIHSSNERSCVHGGRFFFACRCRSSRPWIVCEHDCDIAASKSGAKEIGVVPELFQTAELSVVVNHIIDNKIELPKRGVAP